MTGLAALWLPILLSAVVVFVASSLIHMALPWHKNDYPRLANEDALLDALRPLGLPPGDYMAPRAASREDMRSEAFAAKLKRGPVVVMTVFSGTVSMARNLVQWFVYVLVVSVFAAYITGRALGPAAEGANVFRFAAATAFLAYAAALWQMSIWYRRGWTLTLKSTVDGLIYALLTGALFAWLWPR